MESQPSRGASERCEEMMKARIGGPDEDYGPCGCGKYRATIPVAIPISWVDESPDREKVENILKREDFQFAMGYDYRRFFGAVKRGEFFLNFSCCPDCRDRAVALGIAEEVDDVGFSSNLLVENLLDVVSEKLNLDGLEKPS